MKESHPVTYTSPLVIKDPIILYYKPVEVNKSCVKFKSMGTATEITKAQYGVNTK